MFRKYGREVQSFIFTSILHSKKQSKFKLTVSINHPLEQTSIYTHKTIFNYKKSGKYKICESYLWK